MTRARLLARFNLPVKALPILTQALLLYVGARLVSADTITLGTFLIAFQLATFSTQLSGGLDGIISTALAWERQFASGEIRKLRAGNDAENGGRGSSSHGIPVHADDGAAFDRLVLDGLRCRARRGGGGHGPRVRGSRPSPRSRWAGATGSPCARRRVDLAESTRAAARRSASSARPFLFADTLAETLLGGNGDEAECAPRSAAAADDVVAGSTVVSMARSSTAASRCRAGNASGSRSPVHSSTRRACWCSMMPSAR